MLTISNGPKLSKWQRQRHYLERGANPVKATNFTATGRNKKHCRTTSRSQLVSNSRRVHPTVNRKITLLCPAQSTLHTTKSPRVSSRQKVTLFQMFEIQRDQGQRRTLNEWAIPAPCHKCENSEVAQGCTNKRKQRSFLTLVTRTIGPPS